ncbi:acetylornithine deacetylase [Rhodalgimonas zhirmunskyi]|uniref:Acetylornithine deacetylase n=1 Tax=Rhodalgimonas zhirmunskyi TaxID=2964767 RepID=A0AAJ1UD46_9RHOB|nr:acetylornithine deacetylase [Rhodoalgimonas zhirmunskyi]MDQ2093702.1 acetylornithine deacetylase [Rhodoalgimonas zhirmunskyi]
MREAGILAHLERLVGFASVVGRSNVEIAEYVAGVLGAAGAQVHVIEEGDKRGILAAIGPEGPGGIMLSGHMDVVPVEGQDWSSDPFRLRREGGRVYGRGTTDMKGFLAAMLAGAERAGGGAVLAAPLKFAFSWDEEAGCLGIPVMLDRLEQTVGAPDLCIVGEPTQMQIATGHKGKTFLKAEFTGEAGHSADAPQYRNALHGAAEFIGALRAEQARLAETGARDAGFGTPYTTVHAGIMRGGTALNIVPDHAEVRFEIRNLAADDPEEIMARLRQEGARIGDATITVENAYPGLAVAENSAEVARMRSFLPADAGLTKVSYGTEAGYFAARGVPALVCGPGDMAQGHKPDEFIEIAQLDACERMIDKVIESLVAG